MLGDEEGALQMLSRSTLGGFFCYDYIASDPLLNPLHSSAEFARILKRLSNGTNNLNGDSPRKNKKWGWSFAPSPEFVQLS